MFLDWFTYGFEKKRELYCKYTSHELNFFLFKKDPEFYSKVVKVFVESKMEKMFVDWYLLAMDTHAPNQFYVEKILAFADQDDIQSHEVLNQFEICLLVDVCMQKGRDNHK